MASSINAQSRAPLGIAIASFGLVLGILVTLGFLNGDALGRVNLLYLLILFAFLPVLSLLISPLILFTNARVSLIGLLGEWSGWPKQWRAEPAPMTSAMTARFRSFFLSQCFSIGLGLGSVFAFLLLLLVSDLSFVWRSTLLDAQQLFPLLDIIATPWPFWPEAQPSLTLLEASQEYRALGQLNEPQLLGAWWRYALAAQMTYNLGPRTIMLAIAVTLQRRSSANSPGRKASVGDPGDRSAKADNKITLADTCTTLAQPYSLIDWAGVPQAVSAALATRLGIPRETLTATPVSSAAEISLDQDSASCLVVVKSWEPPLGELADFLNELWPSGADNEKRERLILPVEWDDSGILRASDRHIDEWRRFAAALSGVKILKLEVQRQ